MKFASYLSIPLTLALLAIFPPPMAQAASAPFDIADGDVAGLVAAIKAANLTPDADTINLASGGTYTLTAAYDCCHGLPNIVSPITINGNGATIGRNSASGTPEFRIFLVGEATGDLTLNDLTITGGRARFGTSGGGLFNAYGTARLERCTITGNSSGAGGGVYNYCGRLTVLNSTISHNTASSWGGGLANEGGGNCGTVAIIDSTIFENRAGDGDAVAAAYNWPGSVVVKNSILTSPVEGLGNDFYVAPGAVTSLGHNIVGDTSGALADPSDLIGDPQLGPLADNGGLTWTHAPLPGSPVLDAVPTADCTDAGGAVIATDQRGVARPQGAACDVGAFELTMLPQVLLTVAGTGPFQNQLMVVNPDTCSAKPIGVTQDSSSGPVRRIRGLAYAPSGELYGVTREGDIVTVDRFSGTTTLLGTVGSSPTDFWSGLALDPTGMALYAVNAFGTQNLARFTLPAGPAVQIGPTRAFDFNYQVLGLAFEPGVTPAKLYGANRNNDNIVEVDPLTGALDFTWGSSVVWGSNRQQITVHPGTNELWGIHDWSHIAVLFRISSPFPIGSNTPTCQLPFGILEITGTGHDTYGWGGLAFVPDDYNVAWTSCTTLGITCNDNNPCTDDVCDPATGACSNPPKANGASCDDGNACTQTDTCQPGQGCVGANPVTCTASDDCHDAGTCDPSTGECSSPEGPDGNWCDDGNGCTQTDTCQAGACTGSDPVVCPAPDQCHTAGTCSPSTGVCSNPPKPIGTSCDDGNVCTLGDSCQAFSTGGSPLAALIQGTDGALYGMANQGGSNGAGTVFKLNRDGTGFSTLMNFDGSTTGGNPEIGDLIQGPGPDFALYGTTTFDGTGGSAGTVFKLNLDGTFNVLANFDGAVGRNPVAGLIQGPGPDFALYGTAYNGGSYNSGTLFKLNPNGSGFTVLVNFDGSTTGHYPNGLIQGPGPDFALYGTTAAGGSSTGSQACPQGCGTVFKLNPIGGGFTVLANLDDSTTGRQPIGDLIQGADGWLYGTTAAGGSYGWGTVFKLNPDDKTFTVLWNFDGTMGGDPAAGLIQGADGALYGTTIQGGSNGRGTVFKLNLITSDFTVLWNFDGATTGGHPWAALIQGPDGALYGTARNGGSNGGGTVFKLNPDGTGFSVLAHLSLASDRACSASTATINCDDNSPCTVDSCDPAVGCVHPTITDTTPPTISCPANVTSECQSAGQGIVSLFATIDGCGTAAITNDRTPSGADASGSYPLGNTTVTFTASDGSGNTASCQTVVTIVDTQPPIVSSMSMSPETLFATGKNNILVPVTASYTATDLCSPVVCSLTATSSDLPMGPGDKTAPDIQITPGHDHDLLLRVEQLGKNKRIYTTVADCVDSSGNRTGTSAAVTVVKSNSGNNIIQPGTQVDPIQP